MKSLINILGSKLDGAVMKFEIEPRPVPVTNPWYGINTDALPQSTSNREFWYDLASQFITYREDMSYTIDIKSKNLINYKFTINDESLTTPKGIIDTYNVETVVESAKLMINNYGDNGLKEKVLDIINTIDSEVPSSISQTMLLGAVLIMDMSTVFLDNSSMFDDFFADISSFKDQYKVVHERYLTERMSLRFLEFNPYTWNYGININNYYWSEISETDFGKDILEIDSFLSALTSNTDILNKLKI